MTLTLWTIGADALINGEVRSTPNDANKWIKAAFKELKANFPRCKCKKCREAPLSKLEFVHKRLTPISGQHRGRKEKYYDIVNHPKSYILMTRRHHMQKFKAQHSRQIRKGKA